MEDNTWEFAEKTHKLKYRQEGETFEDAMHRIANHLKDDEDHYDSFYNILSDRRFLPGGRIQAAAAKDRRRACRRGWPE